MITHVVLFQPRAPFSAGDRDAILNALAAAVSASPTVRACRAGRRVLHGRPGYEQAMQTDYQFVLFLDFDDVDGLLGYLANPAHAAVGEYFTSAASASLAYDYEVVDLSEVRRLFAP